MGYQLEFWQFIHHRLQKDEALILLVVAQSSGSSPGRAGYKMAIASDGEISGSIGGGVMEVNLVERARSMFSESDAKATANFSTFMVEQVHQRNADNPSGMICSGRQTVMCVCLSARDLATVETLVERLQKHDPVVFEISNLRFQIVENAENTLRHYFSKSSDNEFSYQEKLGPENELVIIGGGHCALALSELMSRLDFRISIFDDRTDLNTIAKNEFADEVTIVDRYENITDHVAPGKNTYVAVMTLGYNSDAVVIRQLADRDFKYFGVLGSKAKMATLMRELRAEGLSEQRLSRIRTPIGLPINSQKPEEIAISIAAEIISVKNAEPSLTNGQ